MRKKLLKSLLLLSIISGTLITIVPTAVDAMKTQQESDVTDNKHEKIEELRDELQEFNLDENMSDEKEYKELSEQLSDLELKYEEFNYQEEVNLRLSTLQASLEDIKKEINRSTDDKIKIDLEYRYKKLVKIYNKYTESVKNIRDESSYEKIAYSLNNDLENTYEIINN